MSAVPQIAIAASASLTSVEYDAENIQVLEGLEGVRKRPGMYIGDVQLKGANHMAAEIIDNSVDEHVAGHCSRIDVTLHRGGSLTVKDNGRGIPVGIHPKFKISAATVAVTMLHAGGKFANESGTSAYKTSGGLHGVGASVVNALSSTFEMTIERDGSKYYQAFENGAHPRGPLARVGKSEGRGTTIHFQIDRSIFKIEEGEPVPEIRHEILVKSLMMRAYLNPGLTITLRDENTETSNEWKAETFAEILDVISENRSAPALRTLSASGENVQTAKGDVEVSLAFRVHPERTSVISSFANNVATADGGSHEAGFRAALLRAYNKYAETNGLAKEPFTAEDVREGLVAAVSVRLVEPAFGGQTKERLTNTEVNGAVSTVTYQLLTKFFEENPKEAKSAIARAALAAKGRAAAEKARETVERKNPLSVGTLPGKLADCQEKDASLCELFIVEGDSAGGSAKQGRDRRIQAILPLKGKPLNVWRVESIAAALESEEIRNVVEALGAGSGEKFDLTKIRYYKIIILSDADVDGAHIRTILATLFHRATPGLIGAGYLYIGMPPLYKISKGKGDPIWLSDDAALKAFCVAHNISDPVKEGWEVSRFKGLGEMSAQQLWDTTLNPETRSLMKVVHTNPEAPLEDDPVFEMLMGEDVPPRKEFIMEKANFAEVDLNAS